ncbi:MAG TPA: type II toxin-antitoxin system prevent-host-death family antitoxin [Candidatus Limnocylindrales bacterium]|jgi:prevent-host-death family protein
MAEVTIRELRNRGGDVVDRVAAGEHFTVTRDGRPVAELRPYRSTPLSAAVVLRRWRRLPAVDFKLFRGDVDDVIDPRL